MSTHLKYILASLLCMLVSTACSGNNQSDNRLNEGNDKKEMLFQSTGKRLGASLLSAVRSGLLFIPTLLILPSLRGLAGIQEAQPLSLLLSVPFTVLFAVRFFRMLPKEDI